MRDCSEQMNAYHEDRVTLPESERKAMRGRRDANRDRLHASLEKKGEPRPYLMASQGSYAMRTMVQSADKDYDVDDGAYFDRAKLVTKGGAEMAPLDVRKMIAEALADARFKRQPEVRENCVRVFYDEGYHVDVPAYRRTISKDTTGRDAETFELASADWKPADARQVTTWFDDTNQQKSPTDEPDQFQCTVRLLKTFARSRSSWKGSIATGFAITKLAEERFVVDGGRLDRALRRTMEAIADRLEIDTVVRHPVIKGDTISKSSPDPRSAFLRDRLKENLKHLAILDDPNCTHEQAMDAWAAVFDDEWFKSRPNPGSKKSGSSTSGAGGIFSGGGAPSAVNKRGGGRYARGGSAFSGKA